MTAVLTLGETMALYRAEAGGLETAASARIGIGGADSNVAIGVARLGVSARWVGRVGDDSLGRRVVREIRGEGVDVRARIDAAATTAVMLKERRTPDSTRVTFFRRDSAGSRLRPDDLDDEMFSGVSVLHLTGITASLSPSARDTVHAAIERARARGIMVSFDVNHRSSLWGEGDPSAVYRPIAESADIVFTGLDEAAQLLGTPVDDLDARAVAERICALGPTEAVVKLGAEGALALVDGSVHTRPAFPIRPVDTVGAGDAFVAGYLAGRVDGGTVDDSLRLACACGAFACLSEGDWEGYPYRGDLGLLEAGDPVSR